MTDPATTPSAQTIRPIEPDPAARLAEQRLLADLIDTLLAEAFFDESQCDWLASDCAGEAMPDGVRWHRWWIDRSAGDAIVFVLRASIIQPWRYVAEGRVWLVRFGHDDTPKARQQLTPTTLMEHVIAQCLDEATQRMPGVANVLRLIDITLWQTAQSLRAAEPISHVFAQNAAQTLQASERRAARRDRPFHPVAKAKQGLDPENHARYAAEFDHAITLRWIAVKRQAVQRGTGGDGCEPVTLLLEPADRDVVEAGMAACGVSQASHLAMPVHPWQMDNGLKTHLPMLYSSGDAVQLPVTAGQFLASSSLRSLAPIAPAANHRCAYLKLPLAVFSLGAARYLPAVKLVNGERGQRMLEQARTRDDRLAARLHLCDERRWWSYMPEGQGLFDDAPRHLGVMVRGYPEALLAAEDVCLLTMAALGVAPPPSHPHFFDEWLAYRGLADDSTAVTQLFAELCDGFFDIVLRLYRLGLMPEVHGQNVVLIWRSGRIDGMLLRDHDSVRLHPPWIERHGIDDPDYQIRPGYSNSLYNDSPVDLLFYLQTLGIQVNLFAIIETLSDQFGIEEPIFWQTLERSLVACIDQLDFDSVQRRMLDQVLFEADDWPLKLVLRPLLEQLGVPGAMPSGKSRGRNPFRVS